MTKRNERETRQAPIVWTLIESPIREPRPAPFGLWRGPSALAGKGGGGKSAGLDRWVPRPAKVDTVSITSDIDGDARDRLHISIPRRVAAIAGLSWFDRFNVGTCGHDRLIALRGDSRYRRESPSGVSCRPAFGQDIARYAHCPEGQVCDCWSVGQTLFIALDCP